MPPQPPPAPRPDLSSPLWAIFDQSLYTFGIFTGQILLARWLDARAYGIFSIGYSAFLFAATLHTALLIQPMLALGAGVYASGFRSYFKVVWKIHIGFCVASLAIFGAAAGISWIKGEKELAAVLLTGPAILFAIQALWLMRRANYVENRPSASCLESAAFAVLFPSFLTTLHLTDRLSAATACCAVAAAAVLPFTLARVLRPRAAAPATAEEPGLKSVLAHHAKFAPWTTLTSLSLWFPTYVVYFFLPSWIGFEGSARLRAYTNLFMPLTQINAALSALFLPQLVRAFRAHGREGLSGSLRQRLLLILGLGGVYLSAVWFWGPAIAESAYDGRYVVDRTELFWVSLFPLTTCASSILSGGFLASGQPRRACYGYLAGAVTMLFAGMFLTANFLVAGTCASLALAGTTGLAVHLILWRAKP